MIAPVGDFLRRGKRAAGVAILVASLAGATRAAATPVGLEGRAPSAAAKTAEAKEHFQRGVDLYDEGDSSGALVEFSRSYQIVPAFKVLYNMGQLAYQRQDYVAALGHLRRYLEDGGDSVAPERRRQVEQDIKRLEVRIGRIEVETHEDGADILLDDVDVAKAPLVEPLLANVGRRKVGFVSRRGARQTRWVEVAGGETAHVRFDPARPSSPALSAGARATRPGRSAFLLTPAAGMVLTKTGLPTSGRKEDDTEDENLRPRSRGKWLAWATAGLLGAGAATAGAFAYSASRDLQRSRDAYPIASGDLESGGRQARLLAWTSDGLLVGTALVTAWAIYLTARDPVP
ncbi:MAG: hypothetical protein ABUS79_03605 [Pseudomonadota bacterium]